MAFENILYDLVNAAPGLHLRESPFFQGHKTCDHGGRRPITSRPNIDTAVAPELLAAPWKIEHERNGRGPILRIKLIELPPGYNRMISDFAHKCARFVRLYAEKRRKWLPKGGWWIKCSIFLPNGEATPIVIRNSLGECSPAARALLFVGGKSIQKLKLCYLSQLKRVMKHQHRRVVEDLLECMPA